MVLSFILLLASLHLSYCTPWTSLLPGLSPDSRKTDIPESQEGWTSLLASHRSGRHLIDDEMDDGWTSLLSSKDQSDSDMEKAAKIVAITGTKSEVETMKDGPEEKQYLPSFLPAHAGYYSPAQIYQVPSDQDITSDVYSLPHGLPGTSSASHGSVLGLELPTIFNSHLPIHPATNPLTGVASNSPDQDNHNRFPPRRPNFPTPEFLPFPPFGPPNRPGNAINSHPTTTIPTTTKTQTQSVSTENDVKKPPNVPNSRPVRNKKKKKPVRGTTTVESIYDDVSDHEHNSFDETFNEVEETGNFAGLKPFDHPLKQSAIRHKKIPIL